MTNNDYPQVDRIALFPELTKIQNGNLTIAGHDLASLADRYLTPLYVYDRQTLDLSAKTYAGAFFAHYPASAQITYAGKAFLCKAIAKWTKTQNLMVDCSGEGEIAIAVAGGVLRENILVHGVNKSFADLHSALQHAGTMVVDNPTELKRLSILFSHHPSLFPDLWLRLLPGVTVTTHHVHTQTGQHDSKFGMTQEEIFEAAKVCKQNNLPLKGIHFHQGSNFRDPEPLIHAIDMALDIAKQIGFESNWHFCPGGGWGMAYHEDELPHPSIESYVRGISNSVIEGCQARGLGLPHMHLEPGRSLVARAGVALYRVGAVKKRGNKTWLMIDGGMVDNPRHAMYGARYSCLPVSGVRRERSEIVSIAGPYCESGDVLIENLKMPKIHEGDLIAIPMSGAYHLSMSSNYNGARRPAVLMLDVEQANLIQRRETVKDLLERDVDV